MAIDLRIDGYFIFTVFDLEGEPIDEDTEKGVLDKLKTGEYLIGMQSREIRDTEDFSVIYKFDLDPQDSTEYSFEEPL